MFSTEASMGKTTIEQGKTPLWFSGHYS